MPFRGSGQLLGAPFRYGRVPAFGRTVQHVHQALAIAVMRCPVIEGFSIYVPEELAPDVRTAVENGRQLQELMKEAGLRYVRARKAERRPRSRQ